MGRTKYWISFNIFFNVKYKISLKFSIIFFSIQFIIDPDGYTIRKWQSEELNNGILSGTFTLPEYPKIGFWRVRVDAQGQINEKEFKVEKYYLPKFDVYVRMPTFVLDTDKLIEANVFAGAYWEKVFKGDIYLR